jgi:dipeptidyl aminopeptidase/acylaminoacyl peptidase
VARDAPKLSSKEIPKIDETELALVVPALAGDADDLTLYRFNVDGSKPVKLFNNLPLNEGGLSSVSQLMYVPSSDGSRIAFVVERSLEGESLVVVPAAGGKPRFIHHGRDFVSGISWSPSGRELSFVTDGPNSGSDTATLEESQTGRIMIAKADGSAPPRAIATFSHHLPNRSSQDTAWSPDEAWIAYGTGKSVAQSAVRLVRTDGTKNHPIAHTSYSPTLSWHPEGRYLIAHTYLGIAALDTQAIQRRPIVLWPENDGALSDPTLSPGGRFVAFAAGDPQAPVPCVFDFQNLSLTAIGTCATGTNDMFWSPDGRLLTVMEHRLEVCQGQQRPSYTEAQLSVKRAPEFSGFAVPSDLSIFTPVWVRVPAA